MSMPKILFACVMALLWTTLARAEDEKIPAVTNSLGMKLSLIPSGEFLMGSTPEEIEKLKVDKKIFENEQPQHRVVIPKAFYVGQTEVTQGQWAAVMGSEIFERGGALKQYKEEPDYPVVMISWNEVQEFCRKLTEREREKSTIKPTQVYRLPTEEEWEYACRAGTTSAYSFGDDPARLNDYGWWGGLLAFDDPKEAVKHEKHFHIVGAKLPNPWGLYDMHGNVFEWCQDVYDKDAYKSRTTESSENPADPSVSHVIRSGSWVGQGWITRCAKRQGTKNAGKALGFRVVRTN